MGDQDWELGLRIRIGIGNWNWGSGLGIGIGCLWGCWISKIMYPIKYNITVITIKKGGRRIGQMITINHKGAKYNCMILEQPLINRLSFYIQKK